MDLICIFSQILHGIRARFVVSFLIFGEKGERGFDITDLTFFGLFFFVFGGGTAAIRKK